MLQLESELHERVIGQEEAVTCVAEAVQQLACGSRRSERASRLVHVLGPTGAGKTELAKALALLSLQLRPCVGAFGHVEYMEKHSVARLIGAPPGYIGYDEGGMLTDAVRQKRTRSSC